MASNLSTIGFTFSDDHGFEATMVRLANEARERLATDAGEYAIWRSRTGAEIWFHLGLPHATNGGGDGERDIIGLTPYFEGESSVPVAITEHFQRGGDNPLEGLLHVWVTPDDTGVGSYPLVVEALDYAAHLGRNLPARSSMRISGFCRELRVFATADDMLAADESDDDDGMPLAPESLIPIGLFADPAESTAEGDGEREDGDQQTPMPTALIRGSVLSHRRLVNEVTGHVFHAMLVKTLEANIDLVVDGELVTTEPKLGNFVEAYTWMFARAIGEVDQRA